MKIVHIYKTFLGSNFGGVEQVIYQIANSAKPENTHTVVSLSNNLTQRENYDYGIKNICYNENLNIGSCGFSWSMFRDYRRIVQEADVIHYHFPWPFADMMHLFWKIKKPSVITYHSDIVRQKILRFVYTPLMHRFLKSMNRIVATSPNYLESSPILQKYKSKVEVIPHGIDQQSYPNPSEEQTAFWRERFGERFFLFVGVLRYYKGLHSLLDALKDTEYPVIIAGTGPLEQELKLRAIKLNLKHVHFVGRVTEVEKMILLKLCIGVLFPSHLRSEAFGITLLEGAMMQKPLISAEIGTGTSYINLDGETGIVIPAEDSNALKNAIQFIWENPQKQQQMGENAAARYRELFTVDKMVQQYENVYQQINN